MKSLVEHLMAKPDFLSVKVWSFPNIPPQYLVLSRSDGESVRVSSSMHDMAVRVEVGVMEIGPVPEAVPPEAIVDEVCGPVHLMRCQTLAPPEFDVVSGIKMMFSAGELIVTAGAMPFSLFVRKGAMTFGAPEYPLDQYRNRNN